MRFAASAFIAIACIVDGCVAAAAIEASSVGPTTIVTPAVATRPALPGITTSSHVPTGLVYNWSNSGTVTTSHTVPVVQGTWGPTANVAP